MKKRSITVNFVFNTLKSIMVILFPLISFPYVSRVLGVEGIGAVQYSQSVISYYALFAALGINNYAVREGVKYRNSKAELTTFGSEIFLINSISTLLVYAVLFGYILLGGLQGYVKLMLICSLTILFTTLAVEWMYQILEEYVFISIRTTIIQFVAMVAMFLFVKNPGDTAVYALITVLASGGYCIFNLLHLRKYIDFSQCGRLRIRRHIRPILVFFGSTVAASIYLNMDVVMLGLFYNDYQVGLYSAAAKIATVIRTIINSISAVVLPRISLHVANGDKEESHKLIRQGANLSMMFAIPAAAGLLLLSKQIIYIFSGKDFLPAYMAARILALNLIFATLDSILYNQILIPHGKERMACIGTILGAVMNLILNAVLIPPYKATGAAIATIISEFCVFLFAIRQVSRLVELKKVFNLLHTYLMGLVPILLTVVVVTHITTNAVLTVLLAVPVSAVLYFVVLMVMHNDVCNELIGPILRKIKG